MVKGIHMSSSAKKKCAKLTWRDVGITIGTLAATTLVCYALRPFAGEEKFEAILFVVAVLIISRFTSGYICGVAASILGVLIVNCIFTYPYYQLNFTLTGYPIAILSMLSAAMITGTLTTRIKEQEQLKIDAERERTRSNLLRAVSHDLRTPLTAISGACSVLKEGGDTLSEQEKNKLLNQIEEDSQWLIRLVENLLIVTRIDAPDGGANIAKESEVVEEVAASALTQFRKHFPNEKVETHMPDELLLVPMDGMLIRQVIMNLFENAAIHADGMTKITLDISREGENAVFRVTDDGRGIDPNLLPHILEGDFKRSVGSSEDKKRNMGIGLSVCSTIISAHEGKMRAYNGQNGGAVFEFTLPLDMAEMELYDCDDRQEDE